jgi:hypothetical protein
LLQLTRDDGKTWTNLTPKIPGLPASSPVSHVEASRSGAGVAYVSFDRHMFDDFRPHVFKTSDFGSSWLDVTGNLPARGYVHVVREDPKQIGLVYVGTELGLFASWSGGKDYLRLHLKDLPAVAVHDVLVHPRENDLIVGTHGRGIYVLDDATPLQTMTPEIREKSAHLFGVRAALRFATRDTTYAIGDDPFRAKNPPYGAILTYWLKEKPQTDTPFKLEILQDGKVVREIQKPRKAAGFNRMAWDLNLEPPRPRKDPEPRKDDAEEKEAESGAGYGGPPDAGPPALPGQYRLRLTLGALSLETPVELRLDPTLSVPAADLRRQFEAAHELRELRSSLNDALRSLDEVKLQLDERQQLAASRRAPAASLSALAKEADAVKARIDGLLKPTERPFYSEGPRVADRVSALFFAIASVNLAPTQAQDEHLAELREETRRALADTRAYLRDGVLAINRLLRESELPEISVSKQALAAG